ncbi:hypothetical protein ACO22_05159 [Paracoccidioides brasiliensis]|uniref:Uncharacterized protein n=1 Tax=Paracoccidioides brasiliensis TaxID=121759 RepID=A0A1D2JB28_PARBR|nr:hypothetical protein ACO22_05159 [Paracoccidioides brasiliensis]
MEESVDDQFPASIEVETEGRTQSGGAGKGANGLELEHGGVSDLRRAIQSMNMNLTKCPILQVENGVIYRRDRRTVE